MRYPRWTYRRIKLVAIYVELRDGSGRVHTRWPDPTGGTFDAAADLDRFVDSTPTTKSNQACRSLPLWTQAVKRSCRRASWAS